MTTERQASRRWMWSVTFATSIIMLFAALGYASGQVTEQIGKREAAKRVVTTTVQKIWEKADKRKGLRANQYEELLPGGTRVQPAFVPKGEKTPVTVCKNPCWLFFIDEDPRAHFAHPVRIILLDAKTGEQQIIKTNWWPLIDGKPVFSKVQERSDPKTVIFDQSPSLDLERREENLRRLSQQIKAHDPCDAWSIIVCGYDDLPDTFDEDTDGMYNVLTALGIPDDHIFFVSPHTTHAGVDQPTSIANVQWAINQVASQADETDKVLFFYSSHGGIDSLSCVPGSPGGGYISATDLDNWLDAITSGELAIVIEACHSGSLIGKYADGTYVPAEDELTGDGETNRVIFTSASTDTSSYGDVDGADDPNPGDSGSETIWGYVEAFSAASADVNSDGEISFNEGWQYAWDNDVSRIRGWNTPQMVHTGLIPNNVYNYCYRVAGDRDLFVADGPGDVGHNSYDYNSTDIWVTQDPAETDHHDVVSGMDNLVNVAVHNLGTASIANVSLKVYWGDTSTATSWPGDFHQIGATHTFGPLASGAVHTYTWTWYVDPSIGLGHHFCLIAVADSPDDPMTGGPPGVTYVAPYDNNIAQKNITIINDPGHGRGTFEFLLKNNTRESQSVDLAIEWVGRPWGSAILILPEDLFNTVKQGKITLENLKLVDVPREKIHGLEVTGKTGARMRGIPLKPGEGRVIPVIMRTEKTKPGQRSELRLRQEVNTVIGVVTARLQEVDPADCGWVTRASVESFADLALKFGISSAKEVSQLFAKAVSGGACREEKGLLEILRRALPLEVDVARQIPRGADPQARKRFASGLKDLEQALETRNIKAALRAQGVIAEAAKGVKARSAAPFLELGRSKPRIAPK